MYADTVVSECWFTFNDAAAVNIWDALAFIVESKEAMEADVDESEEVGHAEEWLQVEPEEERKATGQGKDTKRNSKICPSATLK